MKLGSKHKVDPTFNMSSMTDVVFLLLVFFIMTSKNIAPVGRKVNLPKSGTELPIEIQRVVVTISPDKTLQVDNDMVTEATLLTALNKKLSPKHEDKNENVIVVKGDVENSYGYVMEVVEICSQIDNAVVSLQMDAK